MTKISFELPLTEADKEFIASYLLGSPTQQPSSIAPVVPFNHVTNGSAVAEQPKNKGGRPKKETTEAVKATAAPVAVATEGDDPFGLSDAAKAAMITDDDPFANGAPSATPTQAKVFTFEEMKAIGVQKLESDKEGLRNLFTKFAVGKFSEIKEDKLQAFAEALTKLK